MDVNAQASAVMLLTVSFGKSNTSSAKPLTVKEWARFAVRLRDQGLERSSLLEGDVHNLLSGWVDQSVTLARIESLLSRGSTLGLALEKWQRAGLWVITHADPEYPKRLKQRLRWESPPVLFGCGNKMLLEHNRGIAVVGSRDARGEDLSFTECLGHKVAEQGYTLVSGGARGVDQSAMFGALQHKGTAVGVLADSLLRSATSAKYRKPLLSGDLVLISPSNPELGFDVGRAMARNRYIYCLADAAIIISSTAGKGGTWNGAIEGVRAKWVPVWVKQSSYAASGNSRLVDRGARWLPENLDSLAFLTDSRVESSNGTSPSAHPLSEPDASSPEVAQMELTVMPSSNEVATTNSRFQGGQNTIANDLIPIDFYDLFLHWCAKLTSENPLTSDEIAERLDVAKGQIYAWLRRGVSQGAIKRFAKPVRYQSNNNTTPRSCGG